MKEKILNCVEEEPGILAKKIGKIVGLTRKQVNQIIHVDERLRQDKLTSGWYIKNQKELVTIELPSGWVDSDILENAISASSYFNIQQTDLLIIVRAETKLLMDAVARLICLLNQVADAGNNASLDLSAAKNLRSYFNRAGFYDVIHNKILIVPSRPKSSLSSKYKGNSSSLVEFRKMDSQTRDDGIPKLLFDGLSRAIGAEHWAIYSFITEIYNNVYDHVFELGQTELFAFAACQTYQRRDGTIHTQIVISDCGFGICNTLRPALDKNTELNKYQILTDIELIKEAFTFGRLTRHDPLTDPDHGMGLLTGAAKAKDLGGKIVIRQENISVELEWNNDTLILKRPKTELKSIPGTNICFDFSLEKT